MSVTLTVSTDTNGSPTWIDPDKWQGGHVGSNSCRLDRGPVPTSAYAGARIIAANRAPEPFDNDPKRGIFRPVESSNNYLDVLPNSDFQHSKHPSGDTLHLRCLNSSLANRMTNGMDEVGGMDVW